MEDKSVVYVSTFSEVTALRNPAQTFEKLKIEVIALPELKRRHH